MDAEQIQAIFDVKSYMQTKLTYLVDKTSQVMVDEDIEVSLLADDLKEMSLQDLTEAMLLYTNRIAFTDFDGFNDDEDEFVDHMVVMNRLAYGVTLLWKMTEAGMEKFHPKAAEDGSK